MEILFPECAWRILQMWDATGGGLPWKWFRDISEVLADIQRYEGNYNIGVTPLRFEHQWDPQEPQCPAAWADYWVLDVDVKEDLPLALKTTQRVVAHINGSWQIPLDSIDLYFSGCKGFHVGVPTAVFEGLEPSNHLHLHLENLREQLRQELDVGTIIDPCLRSPRQDVRLVNTRNLKLGLYKIALTPADLDEGTDHILQLAQTPSGEAVFTSTQKSELAGLCSAHVTEFIRNTIAQTDRTEYTRLVLQDQSELQQFIGQIREKISLLNLLHKEFGEKIDPVEDIGNHYRLPCPFHDEGERPNGVLWKEPLPYYRCYSTKCGVEGDAVEIYARIHYLPHRAALRKLARRAGLNLPNDLHRIIEKDKLLHNQMVIHRLSKGCELAKLFRQTQALYDDMLDSDVAFCMDGSTIFDREDSCFFYSVKKFASSKGGDEKSHRQSLNRLLVTGIVRQAPKGLADKANALRRIESAEPRGFFHYARHFSIPRLTEDLIQIAEQKAQLVAPLGKRLSAKVRDELLACGDDLSRFDPVITEEIKRREGILSRMTSDLQSLLPRPGQELTKSELRKRLIGLGYTGKELNQYLDRAIRRSGMTEIIRR